MSEYKCIDSQQAAEMVNQGAAVADIRDAASYASGHITGAYNLSNDNLQDFLQQADPDQPLLVCCYHGISSQPAAQFLADKGFDEVYSINGGFEGWRVEQPTLCEQ
ncbi:thiosulfate sulfurtransferase GlpE [Pontibacter sp. JAM-7]|uniref:thiosulfate sulfurtransferase GlpE n=1 Tax=Pontibacter sp. JAM-7 TaxID=3366581 RepID=UPI003AF5845C